MLVALFLHSDSEVDDLDVETIFVEEHILGLEIPMNYAFVLEVQQYFEYLLDNIGDIGLRKSVADEYLLEEFSSLAELQNQHIMRLIIVDLKQFGDVRVV